jgi:hypothetical protein
MSWTVASLEAPTVSDLAVMEVEVHHHLWVRPKYLAGIDRLRDSPPRTDDAPGQRPWRTLPPGCMPCDEDEQLWVTRPETR